MKKICALLVLLLCLVLSGCGSYRQAKNKWESFSENVSNASEISCKVDLRAEYEEKTAKFALSYGEKDRDATVTVLSPALIRGISAHVQNGSTSLSYEDVVLETGDLDEFGLSPMSALPVIISAMKSGYYDSFSIDGETTAFELVPDDHYVCSVWFSQDMTPLRAEIASQGRVTVYIEFHEWNVS